MHESEDSYEGKSEQGAMAVTTDKDAVRESAMCHFHLVPLGVDVVRKLSRAENAIPTLPEVPQCVYIPDMSMGK